MRTQSLEDRAWRGYDARATIPWILFGVGVDTFVLVGRWYLDELSGTVHRAAVIGAYVTALVGSLLLVAALLYRTVSYTYRLTDRALLIDKGYFSRYAAPIWLDDIAEVKTRSSWIGRHLGYGRVSVIVAAGTTVSMSGVRDPEEFARMIQEERARMKAAKKEHAASLPP